MQVLVVADHSQDHAGVFEAHSMAQSWAQAAPHTTVVGMPFSSDPQTIRNVWSDAAVATGGFDRTALIEIDPKTRQWHRTAAQQVVDAVGAGMSRIIVAGPRYALPDAGAGFLSALDTLISPQDATTPDELVADAEKYQKAVAGLQSLISRLDVVFTYTDNIPLTGMHGMSGTAALLGDLGQLEAQEREKLIAGLVFALNKAGQRPGTQMRDLLGVSKDARESYKDLSRHDAAGIAGGLGFAFLAAGARALPQVRALSAQFDLPQAIAGSDLIVVKQEVVDGRTLAHSTLGVTTEIALKHATPVIVLTHEQIMSTRELAAAGVSACYVTEQGKTEAMSARLAASWTPNR